MLSPVPSSSVTTAHEHQSVDVTSSRPRASKDKGRDDGLVIDMSTAVWNRLPPKDGAAAESTGRGERAYKTGRGPCAKEEKVRYWVDGARSRS
jgi:hypothetical protein